MRAPLSGAWAAVRRYVYYSVVCVAALTDLFASEEAQTARRKCLSRLPLDSLACPTCKIASRRPHILSGVRVQSCRTSHKGTAPM